MAKKIRLLVIGAHPDDCDIAAGGLAALYVKHGHAVQFVSMTNGDTGHHRMGGGELMPTLEARRDLVRIIREFKPDLVLSHSPDDYHPDHRYTSVLVQDSAYSATGA